MTPREIALSICEPWFNGDPCEGCKCHKVCTKLVERIETAIQAVDSTVADHIVGANKKADHIPDVGKMVASVREDRTVEPVAWWNKKYDSVMLMTRLSPQLGGMEGIKSSPAYAAKQLVPLYTAPPKREPLTEAQIESAVCNAYVEKALTRYDITIARAIERAHGIGGEE